MNQVRACFCLDAVAGGLSCRHCRLAENDFSAVALDGFSLHGGGILRHDDPGGDSSPRCRAGYRSAMIAARLRDYPSHRLSISQRKDGIGCPTNFERAGLLQVFALEE